MKNKLLNFYTYRIKKICKKIRKLETKLENVKKKSFDLTYNDEKIK